MKFLLAILFSFLSVSAFAQVPTVSEFKDEVDTKVRNASGALSITKGTIADLYDDLADMVDLKMVAADSSDFIKYTDTSRSGIVTTYYYVDSLDQKKLKFTDTSRGGIAATYHYVDSLDGQNLKLTDTSRSGIVTTYWYADSLNARNIKYDDTASTIATDHELNTAIAGIITDIEGEHDSLVKYNDSGTVYVTPYTLADSTETLRGLIPASSTYPKWTDTLVAGKLTTKHQEQIRDSNALHINVDSPEYHKWIQAAIIYPVRDTITNTNTWHLLRTGGHSPINVDSVSATTSNITIYYTATANEVKTMVVSPDESNISAQEGVYKSTDPYYTNGAFNVGPSVGFSTATFVMSKPGCFCGTLLYDSVNNTFSHQVITYAASVFATNALPFTVTYNTSTKVMDIQTNKVKHIQGEPSVKIISDNNARHALLATVHPILATTRVQAKFWKPYYNPVDSTSGFELARLPHNAIISYNFGPATVTVNPLTERFSANSNYFIFAAHSGVYDYNH